MELVVFLYTCFLGVFTFTNKEKWVLRDEKFVFAIECPPRRIYYTLLIHRFDQVHKFVMDEMNETGQLFARFEYEYSRICVVSVARA